MPRDRPREPQSFSLSAVAFSPVSCPYTFDRERARSVFTVGNNTTPDVVLFGDGIAHNRESTRVISEERRRVAPTCRIAFLGS